jgi:hypothetical protein
MTHAKTMGTWTLNCRCLAVLALGLLSACHDSAPTETAAAADTEAEATAATGKVELEPDAIEKLGIATTPASAATFAAEAAGFGVVLGHDVIAQAVADVATAEAALHQSQLAMERVRTLAETPGALSFETRETAERQVTADDVALTLARRKFSATFGQHTPWEKIDSPIVRDIASGKLKLIRATFSFGQLTGGNPHSMRIARLDTASEDWTSKTIWDAPADATIPGRSLFILLGDSNLGEGERVNVWASGEATEAGVTVPKAAVVLSEGEYWCYLEKPAGTFVRTPVDISKPMPTGYFVAEGVAAGDPVVTTAAGLLLARETNPSTEAE